MDNIKIGINYLSNANDKIYNFLKEQGFLDILKFPGEKCTLEELNKFVSCVEKYNFSVDIHGIPGIIPASHDKSFIENVEWEKINKRLFSFKGAHRYSTHIGLKNGDKIDNYTKEELKNIFENNIKNIKKEIKTRFNIDIKIGGEMKPGKFKYDFKTLYPEFISEAWDKLDFGVFDIAHVELISENTGISYEEYKKRLRNTDKIRIIHVSENKSPLYPENPDTHVMISEEKIKKLLELLDEYKNVDSILSEYTFKGYYSREKEIAIDVITMKTVLETKNLETSLNIYKFLKKELLNDCSNIQEIILKVRGEY